MHVTYFCELLINNNPPTEQQTKPGRKREPRRKGAEESLEFAKGLLWGFRKCFLWAR